MVWIGQVVVRVKVRVSLQEIIVSQLSSEVMETVCVSLVSVFACVCVFLEAWLSQVLIKPSTPLTINIQIVSICRDCCLSPSSLSLSQVIVPLLESLNPLYAFNPQIPDHTSESLTCHSLN